MPVSIRIAVRWLPVMALLGGLLLAAAAPARANDYPTEASADYVFGCMASNGETQDALKKCSCSIDVIASILPYEEYVKAETVLRMRQMPGGGDKMELFRDTAVAKDTVDKLKQAQTEAEVRCF
jgi:hypothetical protein